MTSLLIEDKCLCTVLALFRLDCLIHLDSFFVEVGSGIAFLRSSRLAQYVAARVGIVYHFYSCYSVYFRSAPTSLY